MFKIEDLLNFFDDERVIELVTLSYYISQQEDKELSDKVFEQLLIMKETNPKLDIVIDTNKDRSFFDPEKNIICMNTFSIPTFFHELTHMFSYSYMQFEEPVEFSSFKESFASNKNNMNLMVQLLNLCKKEKDKLVKDSYDNNFDKNTQQSSQSIQLELISFMEDIIDSLYDGESFSNGLTSIKDINSYALKSRGASGHGCAYFDRTNYQFEEILANYSAIKMIDSSNELFIILKRILGSEFVAFLDSRCEQISNIYFYQLLIYQFPVLFYL